MVVPLEWRVGIKGSGEVKAELDDLSDAFNRAKQSGMGYAREQRALSTAVNRRIGEDRLQNRLLLAQHPSLLRVSRGLSTVTSISRTFMTISNALNIAKFNSMGIDREQIALNKDIRALNEEIAAELRKQFPDMEKVNQLRQELNELMGLSREKGQALIDQNWSDMALQVQTSILAISSVFSLLIKNKTISAALVAAGSFFGTIFAGFFTFASNVGIAALDWLYPTLTGKSAMTKVGTAGTRLGAAFGWALNVAAAVAMAAGAVVLIDILSEALGGSSQLKKTTGSSGAEIIKDITGIEVFPEGHETRVSKTPAEIMSANNKGTETDIIGKSVQDGIKTAEPYIQSFIDLLTNGLPQAYSINDTAINESMMVNIPTTILESTPIIQQGYRDLWNGMIEITNSAGGTIVSAVNSIFMSLINALNSAIRAYNSAARKIGKSTVSTVSYAPSTYTPIPLIAAARGFEGMINQPTMFMTGENGPEHVSVTPNGGGRNGGGGNIMYVTVQGSILSERQLFKKLDDLQKQNLKGLGFTGY